MCTCVDKNIISAVSVCDSVSESVAFAMAVCFFAYCFFYYFRSKFEYPRKGFPI